MKFGVVGTMLGSELNDSFDSQNRAERSEDAKRIDRCEEEKPYSRSLPLPLFSSYSLSLSMQQCYSETTTLPTHR